MNSSSLTEISEFEIKPLCKPSDYIKTYQLHFKQNGVIRIWDSILSHESVSCLLHDDERDVIILVRQFRPVVYVSQMIESSASGLPSSLDNLSFDKTDPKLGITYELCAGIVDKQKDLIEIMKDEILEECNFILFLTEISSSFWNLDVSWSIQGGYNVPIEAIFKVNSFRAGVGLTGAKHTTYYAKVNDRMRVDDAGGGIANEGEFIETFELKCNEIREFMKNESYEKPGGLLYSLNWFLYEKEHDLAKFKNA
jgi:UDP-sugar diphosphatase